MAEVTIVLPIYNEAQIVGSVFHSVHRFALGNPGYEFVFVDDGSIDDSAALLNEHIQRSGNGRCRLVSYTPNCGKGFAVRKGVLKSYSDYVCFMDGDLAYSLDHLPLLVNALKSHDVVTGSRSLVEGEQQNIQPSRRIMGWCFNRLARLVLNLPYRDTQAGLKGFRREVAERIFGKQRIHDFTFDAELLFLAKRLGYRIAEVPARVSDSHVYKGTRAMVWQDNPGMLFSLLKVRCNYALGKYD